jgi:hypothetical protein
MNGIYPGSAPHMVGIEARHREIARHIEQQGETRI